MIQNTMHDSVDSKKTRIILFLEKMKKEYSEPMPSIDRYYQLTNFYDKRDIYQYFMLGYVDHLEKD